MPEKEIKEFIDNHIDKIKPLFKKARLAYWTATTTGNKAPYKEYEILQKEIERIYNNKDEFELVKKFYKSELKNLLLKRQIKILYLSYLGSQGDIELINKIIQLSTEMERKFNTFRAKIGNKECTDNEIKDILQKETNSKKLEEAWNANKEQGALVEKELLELVKLRNKKARGLGFKNYHQYSLELNEQTEQEITSIFNKLAELTEKSFWEMKKEIDFFLSKRYREKELKPWHYQDLFFQEAPQISKFDLDKYYNKGIVAIAKKFYSSLALPVDDILARSDLYEKPGKYQHAYCMDIDREGDIRSVMNIKNDEKWMETILHELGHGVYWKYIDKNLPYLLRDTAHTLTTEAVAQFFGRNSKNISFIKNYSSIKENEVISLSKEVKKMLKLRQLIFSRWSQVMFHFEKSLYENPNQNLNLLWWKLVKKYQLIDFSRDKPDWASKIHFVSSPVYYHNYLLGELFASQIQNTITKKQLHVGEYLKKSIFGPGACYKWDEFIEKAVGEKLNPKYYVKEFCS
ncbi:MAG: M3 family metallopeptidase [Nanoarchaeota archaeon]